MATQRKTPGVGTTAAAPRRAPSAAAKKRSPPIDHRPRFAAAALEHELAAAREQQAATGEILRVISSSPGSVQPVFDTIVVNAARLCAANLAFVMLHERGWLRLAARTACTPQFADYLDRGFAVNRETTTGRAALERKPVQIADFLAEAGVYVTPAHRSEGVRTVLAVPMLHGDSLLGVIAIWRREARPFSDSQIALLRTFADQAVIAIENSRLFSDLQATNRELSEALDQQTATGEVLGVISRSTTDAQPVFDAIAAAALRLCSARSANVFTYDGERVHLAAMAVPDPRVREAIRSAFPRPLDGCLSGTRAILRRTVVEIPDVFEDPTFLLNDREVAGQVRSVVGVPLMRSGEPIGSIAVGRPEPGPFPPQQVALLHTFSDQAVIAIENARLFRELEGRNRDLTEALEQQTATSDILRVIASSPTDVQPVFDTIAKAAMRLCNAGSANVFTFDGKLLQIGTTVVAVPEAEAAIRRIFPRPPDRGSVASRAVLTRSVVAIPDVTLDADYAFRGVSELGFRSVVGIPLLRDGEPIGAIAIGKPVPGPFPLQQVELLQTFARQAVIAIENVRLFKEVQARNRELSEALEQQVATSEILRVISRSPSDVQPVFETIAASALRLCEAGSANVFTFDGALLHIAALAVVRPGVAETIRRTYPRPPDRGTAASRAVLTRAVVEIPDVLDDPDYVFKVGAHLGFRSVLGIPLLRENAPIGAIAIGRSQPGPFPVKQIALAQTFADQAVIAIDNARLFRELQARNRDLTEALEQQTATAEILRVISQSPTDVQPVFDSIAASAMNLLGASSANVFTFDGQQLHLAASHLINPEGVQAVRRCFPRPPDRGTAASRAVLERSPVAIHDVLEYPEYALQEGPRWGFRSALAVPLLRDGTPIGAIAIGRSVPGPFADKQVTLLQTFADQAVIAIENVRLFRELETRTAELSRSVEELRALGEVGQAVSSTLDLETVLRTIVSRVSQLASVDGGAIFEYEPEAEEFRLQATDGLPDELVEALGAAPMRKGEGLVGRLALTGEAVALPDITVEGSYQSRVRDILFRHGYRALMAVPLLRESRVLGGLVVNRKEAGEFAPRTVELLKTFATQSALAIQNARLFRELEDKGRQLEVASRHKSTFVANMSHELRTPLNAIIGFTRIVMRRSKEQLEPKQYENLDKILTSAQHLLSLINAILDLAKVEAGRVEIIAGEIRLPPLLAQCARAIEPLVGEQVTLRTVVPDDLPPLVADEEKLRQIVVNLLSNAAKFTAQGSIEIHARAADSVVEIAVADTGVGIAEDKLGIIFEEFEQADASSTRVHGGTGLGLAIARRLARLMGGEIRVESRLGAGSTFTVSLPAVGLDVRA